MLSLSNQITIMHIQQLNIVQINGRIYIIVYYILYQLWEHFQSLFVDQTARCVFNDNQIYNSLPAKGFSYKEGSDHFTVCKYSDHITSFYLC